MSQSQQINEKKRHESSPIQRARIMEAVKFLKGKDVAKEFNVSPAQVSFLKNHPDHFKDGKSAHRSGGPSKLTERDKRLLLRNIMKDPEIKVKEMPALLNNKVGLTTINKWRKQEGIVSKYKTNAPYISKKNKRKKTCFYP